MKIIIFGLTITSSWGNGHATIWRGLCAALARRGHQIDFFEKNVPYYASTRDMAAMAGVNIILYNNWKDIHFLAAKKIRSSDVCIITSYCPDALTAKDMATANRNTLAIFYDLDTPVTLNALENGSPVEYIGSDGLKKFDLVLSYTGGEALDRLKTDLGAVKTEPLYGCSDPQVYNPVKPIEQYQSLLSYLGTYAADRQEKLHELFLKPAKSLPNEKFAIAGSLYPPDFSWQDNIWYFAHVAPEMHPAFYCSSRFTLNVTRGAMAKMGYCPSPRLFEATACGAVLISDNWPGLDTFFEPDTEIMIAENADQVCEMLKMSPAERETISEKGRKKTLSRHTAMHRAIELEQIIEQNILSMV